VPRILILEDYPPLRRALAVLLQRAGYEVALARTVRETSQMLGQQSFDVLVMDMDLPKENGWYIREALQAAPCYPPLVVLLSRQSHGALDVRTLDIQTILYKPVGQRALLTGIATSLKSRADDD
jgi:two-component system KDP operon response regulator KdpE